MWIIWALIIFGGVWDAADCIILKYTSTDPKTTACLQVYDNDRVTLVPCNEGYDAQIWLWKGKMLQNRQTVQCLYIDSASNKTLMHCRDNRKEVIAKMEFTRFGKHGLKNPATNKCLKMPMMRFAKCEEDMNDPYYE
jgi:hypothetical protein